MKHAFQSAVLDSTDTSLVRPSNWNAVHVIGVTTTSVSLPLTAAHDLVYATGGSGGITITLPAASAQAGRCYSIQKGDAGVGAVTVAPTGNDTIGTLAGNYLLEVQFQYLEVVSNGVSDWIIKSCN
jgi:hypothetical protein